MNKKGFVNVIMVFAIALIVGIMAIPYTVTSVKSNVKANADDANKVIPQMQKARKKSFADEGLAFAKAAESAYVDEMKSGTQCYEVKYLIGKYISSTTNTVYEGKVIVNASIDGNITGETIYLKNNQYKIVNTSINYLIDNYEEAVFSIYDNEPLWNDSYTKCE